MTTQLDHLPTHDPVGWGGGREGGLSWGGGRSLASETAYSLCHNPLSGCASHLNDPYVEVPVALNGWEALADVHPRPGGNERGNGVRVLRPWPPALWAPSKNCHPRACLSLGGPCSYTNASEPGQLLQTLAQRLYKQGPGLLSAIVLLKQGQGLWAGMGFEHRDLCKQEVRNRLCRQTRSAARDSHWSQ